MTYIWEDPDDGLTYEIDYIVTQFAYEGPEYFQYRVEGATEWEILPPFARLPQEVEDHFFGPLIHEEEPCTQSRSLFRRVLRSWTRTQCS